MNRTVGLLIIALIIALSAVLVATDVDAAGPAVQLKLTANGHSVAAWSDVHLPATGPGTPQWDAFASTLWTQILAARLAVAPTTTTVPGSGIHHIKRWMPIRNH